MFSLLSTTLMFSSPTISTKYFSTAFSTYYCPWERVNSYYIYLENFVQSYLISVISFLFLSWSFNCILQDIHKIINGKNFITLHTRNAGPNSLMTIQTPTPETG